MSTLVVHLETEAQEKAVKAVLEALQVSFEDELDETEYLMSSPTIVARLEQSEKDIEAGKGVKVDVKNLWK
jgi:PHD/YefM family antitoxin component YafN of YafNO toxin-antitoxin module